MGERNPQMSGKSVWRSLPIWAWMVVAALAVLCLTLFLCQPTRLRARASEVQECGTVSSVEDDGSPLVRFSAESIAVKERWSLLAGIHPTVTFQCRLDESAPSCKRAVLCYRALGEGVWSTVETRLNRERVARITLRDLYCDMPYECFFVIVARDTMFQSAIIRFET